MLFRQSVFQLTHTNPMLPEKPWAAGAQWVNDIWGFRADPELAEVVVEYEVPVIDAQPFETRIGRT